MPPAPLEPPTLESCDICGVPHARALVQDSARGRVCPTCFVDYVAAGRDPAREGKSRGRPPEPAPLPVEVPVEVPAPSPEDAPIEAVPIGAPIEDASTSAEVPE